jgi:uncharacterized cupredoxin-like copper-binding protein
MSRLLATGVLIVLVSFAAAGAAAPATHTTVLHITAMASGLRYDKKTLHARAGKVTIEMKNLSVLKHDVAIKGHGVNVKGKIVGKGGISKVTATLKKGRYEFYCSVDGHAEAGMKGTLTVS